MVKKKEIIEKKLHREEKIALGALAGMMSTSLLHPLDVIKVRMQQETRRVSTFAAFRSVTRCEGPKALYSGLTAGLMRQATYTTTRLGVFYWLYDEFRKQHGKEKPNFEDKAWMGIYAGLAGAVAGCPVEVVLVRMMADGRRDAYNANWQCCPRPYGGLIDGLSKLFRREGVCGYWRGGMLTVGRSVVLSAVHIIGYQEIREIFKENEVAKGFTLRVLTSMVSSFVAALITLPLDIMKTRYQILEPGRTQADVWVTLMRERGFSGLWRGFTPYYTRLFLHTFLTFTILDQLIKMYRDLEPKQVEKK